MKQNGKDVYVAGDPEMGESWGGVAGNFYSFRDELVYWQKVIRAVDLFSKIDPKSCINEIQKFEHDLVGLFGNIVTTTTDMLRVPYLEKRCKQHTVLWPTDDWYRGPKPSGRASNTYIDQIVSLNVQLCKSLTIIKGKIQSVEAETNPTNHHVTYLNMAVAILGWLDYYQTDDFWYCSQNLLENTYVTDNPELGGTEALHTLDRQTIALMNIELVKEHTDQFGITEENRALFADSFEKLGYPFTHEGIAKALSDAQHKLDTLRLNV